MTDAAITAAISQSVQTQNNGNLSGGVFTVNWLARSGLTIPAWWSPSRDAELRRFWKRGDHLSGAIYTMCSKMSAIPTRVIAKDPANSRDVAQADRITEVLHGSAQFGEGWEMFFSRFVEDLLTTDNGAFAEIIGPGNKAGPITGSPTSIAHLDSWRCQRTGNPEFPILYRDSNGKVYKLHNTRVIYLSQMASPISDMNGVGFCATSRAINVAQTLIDILNFKQEKLGSRPHRAIVITKGGLDPSDITSAFSLAENAMDDQGLSRYSKIVVAGNAVLPDADVRVVELSQLPDGFDEETSITLGMATIALAFGVDARELFPAMSSGATRADALLSHLKQRGKGPGQIIQAVEQAFNHKYLPGRLRFTFDFQDDAEDRQRAEIKQIRANRHVQDLNSGSITTSVARQQMFEDGDITERQLILMEAQDGRTPDGASILTMFYSKDPAYSDLLDVGSPDPLDRQSNDEMAMMDAIHEKMAQAGEALANATTPKDHEVAYIALHALAKLQMFWQSGQEIGPFMMGMGAPAPEKAPRKPEERLRTQDLTQPNLSNEQGTNEDDNLEASSDDENVTPAPRGARVRR